MAGSQTVIKARTMAELEEKVKAWYEQAAAQGLEDVRLPWDPAQVNQTDDGYEFNVWAHS